MKTAQGRTGFTDEIPENLLPFSLKGKEMMRLSTKIYGTPYCTPHIYI